METTSVTFDGIHEGQFALVRFVALDNASNQVTVQVGSRKRTITTARSVKPCLVNASLLVEMLAGEGRPRRVCGRRRARKR